MKSSQIRVYNRYLSVIIARNSSCGEVMFLQVSVCPQGGCVSQHALSSGGVSQHAVGKWVCIPACIGQGVSTQRGVCLPRGCLPRGSVHTPLDQR